MTSDTREILITNDDGIGADGIHVLASVMRRYGNVTVVAPLHAQSGKSAALSLDTKLYLKQIKNDQRHPGGLHQDRYQRMLARGTSA